VRVLFVHEKAGFHGGVEGNVFDTARALQARGHTCLLSARETTGKDEERFASAFEQIATGWAGESPVTADLERWNADVVYVHKVPDSSFVRSVKARKVRAIHDHDVVCPRRHRYYASNNRVCDRPIGWRCYADLAFIEKREGKIAFKSIGAVKREAHGQNAFDRVLANSRFMAKSLLSNGVEESRVRVVHPVVPNLASVQTPLPQAPNLLFVGQLIRGKGVDLLLQALHGLSQPWHLTVAGDGNMRPELESLATSLGLTDRVRFLGWVPAEEARRLYDDARIACVPCRWPEPFGMVGVEAMRRARPVVAFNVGGIPDWLVDGETGFAVAEQDLDSYRGAIKKLLDDHALAVRLGSNGFAVAEERFGFEGYIDRLEAILGGED